MFRLDFKYPYSKKHGGDMVGAVSQRQLQVLLYMVITLLAISYCLVVFSSLHLIRKNFMTFC